MAQAPAARAAGLRAASPRRVAPAGGAAGGIRGRGGGGGRMSDTLHSGWRRERFGPFAGLSGLQAGAVLLAWLPALTAVGRSRWDSAVPLAVLALLVTGLIVVPIRRRPAIRWLTDTVLFLTARASGWSAFRARVLEAGSSARLQEPDLPGVAAALRFHNGPAVGDCVCVCIIHNPVAGLWAATARLTHPGLGNADSATRDGYAAALGGMLAAAAATEQIARISIQVRTIPDDGAARAAWVADHTSPTSPPAVTAATEALETLMRTTAVRQELFVTVAVAETRIRRAAKEAGGGIAGRARVLARHLAETEQQLRGLGATDVAWLPTQEVAAAIRCGYNPAEAVTDATGPGGSRPRPAHRRRAPARRVRPGPHPGPVPAAVRPRRVHHRLLRGAAARAANPGRLAHPDARRHRPRRTTHPHPALRTDPAAAGRPPSRARHVGQPRSARTCAPNAGSGSAAANAAEPPRPPPTNTSSPPGTPWSASPPPPP